MDTLPYLEFDGMPRVMGALPPVADCGLPDYHTEHEVVSAADLQPIDLSWAVVAVKNQAASSACCGHAAASSSELARRLHGLSPLRFSPWFTYAQINGGVDQGAVISQALRSLQLHGSAPDEMVPYGTIRAGTISQEAYAAALRYQIVQAYRCTSYDALLTALTRGFSVVFGIIVGSNFTEVSADGYAGLPTRANVLGGHALCGVAVRPSLRNRGDMDIKFVNSWGLNYGTNGMAWLERRHFDLRVDAFALQAHESDPTDTEEDLPAE